MAVTYALNVLTVILDGRANGGNGNISNLQKLVHIVPMETFHVILFVQR